MEIKYTEYFTEKIKPYIPSDLSYSVSDEFSYGDDSDIKFTLTRLTGTIDSGVVTIPYQVIAEIDSKYANEIRKILDDFALDFNEIVTAEIGDRVFKQLLSTTYKITAFQSNGLIDRTTFGINVNLVSFGEVDINSIAINYETIELQNFQMESTASVLSVGARQKDNGLLKRKNRDVALAYSLTFIPRNTPVQNSIVYQILSGKNINSKYNLKLILEDDSIVEHSCVISQGRIDKAKNGVLIVSAVFSIGDFEDDAI